MQAAKALSLAVLVSAACAYGQSAVVTIDKAQTFQTIDGNGAMGDFSPWKIRQGPFYVDADLTNFYDSLINVLGFTLHRIFVDGCDFSPSAGQYRISDGIRHFYGTTVARLKAVADANGEPYMVAPAVLSPPAYMKYNNQCPGGEESAYPGSTNNHLIPDQYDEFGDFCAAYITMVRDTFGITPYAFSFQNEPYFNEPYSSCSYSGGTHYAQMLKVAAPKVRALGLPILFYGVEHMSHTYPQWENQVVADASAAPYIDRFAVHGYTDGIQVDTTTFGTITPQGGRPLWMSETSGYCNDYTASMTLARTLMRTYGSSNMSAWIYVGILGEDSQQYGCGWFVSSADGWLSPRYWVYAQFFRFVRPGMKRIAASSSQSDIQVVAFKDDAKGSMSVVLLNTSTTSSRTVTLNISGGALPPSFEVKRTTPTENFVSVGTAAPTDAITVPANSIVSLGYNHVGGSSVAAPLSQATVSTGHSAQPQAHTYDLRGRQVVRGFSTKGVAAPAFGVYCRTEGTGAVLQAAAE